MNTLPVATLIPEIIKSLQNNANLVLCAPPGAGKSTLVPPALLNTPWRGDGRILMLQPRRLAARAVAARMAELRGEDLGETVGYRIRGQSRTGPATRIEVVTEGILTRRLQSDPELSGVAAVIFDEFHERNLQTDLGLALAIESQAALRPDLRLIAMSATLDAEPVARLLGDAPILTCEGRTFPITIRYRPPATGVRMTDAVASACRSAVAEGHRGILAFLPGASEIRRVEDALIEAGLPPDLTVHPLYGALPAEAQAAALAISQDPRIVLATDIAETSLTIDGITAVIDSGRCRQPEFDPRGALTRLETRRISKASAEQRAGRAGRTAPGVCIRLWSEAEHRALKAFTPPEITRADPAPLLLQARLWGARSLDDLAFLDRPAPGAVDQAAALLRLLGALDDRGDLTDHGRAMAALPAEPRLAHMLLAGRDDGHGPLACALAGLLGERDILSFPPGREEADLAPRLRALDQTRAGVGTVHRGARQRAREAADQLRRLLKLKNWAIEPLEAAGPLIALAYPDRIGRRRAGGGYRLVNGRGTALTEGDALDRHEFLAVAHLASRTGDGRIFLAAPLTEAHIRHWFADQLVTEDRVGWNGRDKAVEARRLTRLGAMELDSRPLTDADADAVCAAMIAGIRAMGPDCLPWTEALRGWRARVAFLRGLDGDDSPWPDLSDAALMNDMEDWLSPWLPGVSRASQLRGLDLAAALKARLDHGLARTLDKQAPQRIAIPSGRNAAIDYDDPAGPGLAVKLQEMFGLRETPRIAGGRVALRIQLLSPAGRPLQVTQDLAHFWDQVYPQVRKEMRGRYPKHPWPEDPLTAPATALTKARLARQDPPPG